MNKGFSIGGALVIGAALLVTEVARGGAGRDAAGPHVGTWQLVSTKYGEAESFSDFKAEQRRVKTLAANHYMWVEYDAKTKRVETSAGGPMSFDGKTFSSTVAFASGFMTNRIGSRHSFTLRVEGDKLYQNGKFNDGYVVEEVWQRVK